MKPGFKYQLIVANCEKLSDQYSDNSQEFYVDIVDTEYLINDDEDITIVSVTGADEPIRITTIDNDEDVFTAIRAKQATLRVFTSDDISMSHLVGGGSKRWKVVIYMNNDNNKVIFVGHLILDDCYEDFMPMPQVLELTASDGLGLLKDIELSDFDSQMPAGHNKIIDYLCWSLSKTGLMLPVYCVYNIREETMPGTHFFDGIYLHVNTFMTSSDEFIDCYSVIERILGNSAVLIQHGGAWWIVRVDETESSYYVSLFTAEGVFVEHRTPEDYNKVIAKDDSVIFFSNEQTRVRLQMPCSEVHLEYNYEVPYDTPCNRDFIRGDLINDVSESEKHYSVDCWTMAKYSTSNPNPDAYPSPDVDGYIKRIFHNGYEKERYVVLPLAAPLHTLSSQPIPVHEKDKVDVSFDVRWSVNKTGSGTATIFFANLLLKGDDGTNWSLDDDGRWYQSDSSWTTNYKSISLQWIPDDVDETEWRNIRVESSPVPVDGSFYIFLRAMQSGGSAIDDVDVHYSNLSVDYIPFINGTYRRFSGQRHSVIGSSDNRVTRRRQVYISDSPKKIFKGALFKFSDTGYVLTERFYNAAVFPGGVPPDEYLHPFGEIQVFDTWNQFNRHMRVFNAVCQGTDSASIDASDMAGLVDNVYVFFLLDNSIHTNNRRFFLLHYDIVADLCEWSGSMIEVYSVISPKNYEGHKFEYIEEK